VLAPVVALGDGKLSCGDWGWECAIAEGVVRDSGWEGRAAWPCASQAGCWCVGYWRRSEGMCVGWGFGERVVGFGAGAGNAGARAAIEGKAWARAWA